MEKDVGIYLLIGLILSGLSMDSHATRVYGTIYDCFTLEPLNDVILEVNSTPKQQHIAKSAQYSFDLPRGSYCIKARYFIDNELEYYSEENLSVKDEGDYILDIIMFPALDVNESLFEIPDIEIDINESSFEDEKTPGEGWNETLMLLAVLFIPLLIISLHYLKSRKPEEEAKTEKIQYELYELPEDLRKILTIIRENDGRMTQRELRGRLHHSEAKISLMLADLENRGLIRKFKRGRGNIIVLVGLR
ncbi:MAG: winged helix-turn-helix transcriptional regulator [Candidatus Altiarchaeota archaeon]|nr:winged helix-turn-helix transcriptional regulator [Candidatus Altiarchaeota archaeon]